MRLLLTGFEPFDGDTINPSGEIARQLDGRRLGAATITGRVLPVSFERLSGLAAELVATLQPDGVLSLGLAAGEPAIRLEQIAINRAHSDCADNDGARPRNRPLDPAGPAARIATLPSEPLIDQLGVAGIPARLSFHAGTHCCNLLLYHLLGELEVLGQGARCGFVHLPCLPTQAIAALRPADGERPTVLPSMSLKTMVAATEIMLKAMVGLHRPGGD